ncbi:murein DD-endopeptidase MepM/ murein hydrolase activator NlpD [Pontibacter aydingkolensis]|uniref:Peptidoglycan DD-metalloendopeptidase family protein n=1 Tax=Pontibacter aydingkolensis TaxID=1911536 RepID=A0ABS7CX41_9BACT|nr:peptidoglycan DD-metalloendopeptidase family protein [Pontibacter aydingkolensis]MBW7468087.1 peptidoglycan DD-metalloendopeptidase family protein [Pontibacter aydingkolensis]
MDNSKNLSAILSRHRHAFAPVLDADLNTDAVCSLDFTAGNNRLQQTDLLDTEAFNNAVQQMLHEKQASIGVGGYLEDRFIYRRSKHFDVAAESRNLHLGVDVWLDAGTAVFTPLDATVHSFKDNDNFGDYGPTIILEHELEGVTFYTLYGHLSRASLDGLEVGKRFAKGDKIAEVGPYPENGNWPPHLHFQVMCAMDEKYGDYPGVATTAEKAKYEALCPNPNLILKCRHLS